MKKYVDSSNQHIISVLNEEQDYFNSFVQKHNIKWCVEDKERSILVLSKSYVGYIVTPLRKINLEPKYKEISFEHIFRMYLYVYGYKATDSSSILDVSETNKEIDIGKLFLDSLQKNIQLGILQTYQMKRNTSKEIRGRVNYTRTYKNYLLKKNKYVFSNVSKLSLNNSYNILIASALMKLMHVKEFGALASKFMMYFEGVNTNLMNGSEVLQRITFNSNTARYKKTLLYAAMIIDQLDYEDMGDSVGSESFILNFDNLFEEFVIKILKDTPDRREFITWISPKIYAEIFTGGVRRSSREYLPDILFKFTQEDEKHEYLPSAFAVLDVKNKAYGTFKNSDIYQILTYVKLLNSKKGLLLYPSFGFKEPETLILNADIFNPSIITACFINIADANGEDFLNSIDKFVSMIETVLQE